MGQSAGALRKEPLAGAYVRAQSVQTDRIV